MEEVWKDIKGYEGLYQASNLGNIRSLNYNGQKGKVQNLKIKVCGTGYYRVKLVDKDGKRREYQWGRIIAETFIPNPENKRLISYIDRDKTNNKASNIEWATYQEVSAKNEIDKKIIYDGKSFKTEKELAKYYGINPKIFENRKLRGWTFEEILTIPVDRKNCCGKPYYYNYNGKYMTLKQISEITGVKLKTMRDRVSRGWDLYSACEIPVHKYKNRKEKRSEENI